MPRNALASQRQLPIRRILIAGVIVSILPPFLTFLPAVLAERPNLHEILLFPLVVAIFAWPGAVIFIVFGVPTLYVLYRVNRMSFGVFALCGAIYTALPWAFIQATARDDPGGGLRNLVWPFVLIGMLNGVIVRVILLGVRPNGQRPSKQQKGAM